MRTDSLMRARRLAVFALLAFFCMVVIFAGVGSRAAAQDAPENFGQNAGQNFADASAGDYVDLVSYINTNKLQFFWDGTYRVGIISGTDTFVSFKPGEPQVIVNFSEMYTVDPVLYKEDQLLVTPRFLEFLQRVFELAQSGRMQGAAPPPALPAPEAQKKTEAPQPAKAPEKSAAPVAKNPDAQPSIAAKAAADTESQNIMFSKIAVVVIDAGHGGKDPGTIGEFTYKEKSYRLLEKTIALNVSKKIRSLLQDKFPRLKIVMTREKDEYVSLEQRIIIANENLEKLAEDEAILFVSIHANGVLTPEPSGYEVWYLPPSYRRSLIEKDNVDNQNIYSVINNIREEEVTLENIQLAKSIITGMSGSIGGLSLNRGIKEEEWYVVRNAKMPAVLVELGFVTNPEEGVKLSSDSYQDTLSKGVANGIANYMELFDVSKIK